MEELEGKLPPNETEKALKGGLQKEADKTFNNKKTETKKHLVFVYGTLMRGFGNHRLLLTSKFIGEHVTANRYKMVSLGSCPAVCKATRRYIDQLPSEVVEERSLYRPVAGELYEVDDEALVNLDALESNGSFYERELVPLQGYDKEVWMYILCYDSERYPRVTFNEDRHYSWKAEHIKKASKLMNNKRFYYEET